MNKQDEYSFFLLEAISRPEQSKRKSFFNKESEKLFSLVDQDGRWVPHYRNEHVKPAREKVAFFENMIADIRKNDPSIIELQPISIPEKVEFLRSFIDKYVPDESLKKSLALEIASFGDHSELNFLTDFRTTHWEVFASFDRERALFLVRKIATNYPFVDLDKVLDVVW